MLWSVAQGRLRVGATALARRRKQQLDTPAVENLTQIITPQRCLCWGWTQKVPLSP